VADIRDFALPDLGEGLEDGEIVRWHVEVGDVIGSTNRSSRWRPPRPWWTSRPLRGPGRRALRRGGRRRARRHGARPHRRGGGGDRARWPADPVPDPERTPAALHRAGRRRGAAALWSATARPPPRPSAGGRRGPGAAPRRRPAAEPPGAGQAAGAQARQGPRRRPGALAPGAGPDGSITRAEVEAAAAGRPSDEAGCAERAAPRTGPPPVRRRGPARPSPQLRREPPGEKPGPGSAVADPVRSRRSAASGAASWRRWRPPGGRSRRPPAPATPTSPRCGSCARC
jgi:2-oxoisovalerate dehydrogenase E2 component (dihydrolipoyl transacylase)